MGIIKFFLWTIPFGGIIALLSPGVMSTIAHGSDEYRPGFFTALCKILLTAAFWCGVCALFAK